MATSGIYVIINCYNGKLYVGSAVNFQKRFKNHRIELELDRHCNPYLQAAWNKYGEDNFEFAIVEAVDDLDELLEIEQLWIDASECCDREKGYNLCTVAGNRLGHVPSEETRAIWSAQRKGHSVSLEARAAIGIAQKDKIVSLETRRKQSLSHMGNRPSEETKQKMRIKTFSPEARLRLSLSAKARWAKRDGNIGVKTQNID